ncbi:3-hydroxyacyl-CoA dehydrogenase family protein [Agromyces atrinae]|uniref:3-hydroxyacyl-CoA dehydrogenase family protein n=1 Tax=Agromyces atrinae TaxID=592376 RepID=UPI001F56EE72|nr:3-hydroxyacyl-CoA dehydrogenase family protein [Agromyces atrinae]MCI2957386.1 3-hydroxyacyl-CoA dehydrogenase family protein [Agromyces atrinae]
MIEKIESVAVVGAGYMGGGIAQSLAIRGIDVVIADVDAAATRAARERLLRESEEFEAKGMFAAGSTDALESSLTIAASIEEAAELVDFIEEAVFEVPGVKHEVLARISAVARPDAIIGSNTSTIPVHVMETAVTGPERFLIVHWSNPAPFIPGVELVTGAHTDRAVIPVVKDLLARAGRESAEVADVPGFVLNRLQYILLKEALSIVDEGVATPEDVDTIVRTTFGFRLPFFGPFAIADMAGLDVYEKGFAILESGLGERFATPPLLTRTVEAGGHGTKNGRGFTGEHSPEEVARIVEYRAEAYARLQALLADLGPSPFSEGPRGR